MTVFQEGDWALKENRLAFVSLLRFKSTILSSRYLTSSTITKWLKRKIEKKKGWIRWGQQRFRWNWMVFFLFIELYKWINCCFEKFFHCSKYYSLFLQGDMGIMGEMGSRGPRGHKVRIVCPDNIHILYSGFIVYSQIFNVNTLL